MKHAKPRDFATKHVAHLLRRRHVGKIEEELLGTQEATKR